MKRILLIEDNANLRAEIANVLELEGFVVHQAANGREGLVLLARTRPHLIVCDVMMPGMDGYAFKFSSPSAPVRIVTAARGGCAVLEVHDSGQGITEEQIDLVGRAIRLERDVREHEGLGLGLSIATRIATLWNGLLRIDSRVGVGTSITVACPCRRSEPTRPRRVRRADARARATPTSSRRSRPRRAQGASAHAVRETARPPDVGSPPSTPPATSAR